MEVGTEVHTYLFFNKVIIYSRVLPMYYRHILHFVRHTCIGRYVFCLHLMKSPFTPKRVSFDKDFKLTLVTGRMSKIYSSCKIFQGVGKEALFKACMSPCILSHTQKKQILE